MAGHIINEWARPIFRKSIYTNILVQLLNYSLPSSFHQNHCRNCHPYHHHCHLIIIIIINIIIIILLVIIMITTQEGGQPGTHDPRGAKGERRLFGQKKAFLSLSSPSSKKTLLPPIPQRTSEVYVLSFSY